MARRSGHLSKWYLGDQDRSPTVCTEHFGFIYPENPGCQICQASEHHAHLANLITEFNTQDSLLQQSMDNARHVLHAEENAVQPF